MARRALTSEPPRLDYFLLVEAYRQRGILQNLTLEDIAYRLNNTGEHCKRKIKAFARRGVFAVTHRITIAGKMRELYSFNEEGWEKSFFGLDAVRCAVAYIIFRTGKGWMNMHCPYSSEQINQMLEEFRLKG